MKKMSQEEFRKKAKDRLVEAVVITIATCFFYTRMGGRDVLVVMGLVVATYWIFDGLPALRLLKSPTYFKRKYIEKIDERNSEIEHRAYRLLVKILMVAYAVLGGVVLGYLSESPAHETLFQLAGLGFVGFGLVIFTLYHAIKYYYDRRL